MRWAILIALALGGCSAATVTETYERTPASAKSTLHHVSEARTEQHSKVKTEENQSRRDNTDPFGEEVPK